MGNAEMTLCNGDSASICQADEGPEPKLRHVGAACKEGDLEALRAALPTPRALRALFRAAQAEGNAAEHTSPLWLAARFGHTVASTSDGSAVSPHIWPPPPSTRCSRSGATPSTGSTR